MNYIYNYLDFQKLIYKKNLKHDINTAGGFLIAMYLTMSVSLSVVSSILKELNFDENSLSLGSNLFMIINSLISLVSFFIAGSIYCSISSIKISSIMPFDKNKPSLIALLCALGLSLAMVANYASNAVVSLFESFGYNAYVDVNAEPKSALDIILYYISFAVVPAFAEEFAFRGIVLGCIRKHSESLAILISSIMFGLMHGNFMQIPFAFVVGLVLGFVTVKTNSLLPAIIIHFSNNAISVTFDILSTNTSLSIPLINVIYITIMLAIAISGLISALVLIKNHKSIFKMQKTDGLLNFKEKVVVFCKSVTMIIFAVISLIEAITSLQIGF